MSTKTKKKSVLITGANGFMGRALMKLYKEQKRSVVGVDLIGDDSAGVFQGDLNEPKTWEHLLDECDTVIHTAALVTNSMGDEEMWRANVLATSNVVEAAVRHKIKRFVHISSIVAYGNVAKGELDETQPVDPNGGNYVLTKLASEHVVLAAQAKHGIDITIIRPGDVYGPAGRAWILSPLELIPKGLLMLPENGKGYVRPIYIDDLVRGIALAASSAKAVGEIFNLTCEGYVTSKEFFSWHSQWLGKKAPVTMPTMALVLMAEASLRVSNLMGAQSEASPAAVKQLSTKSWFSINKAKTLLGWEPEVSLEEGMQRTQQWLQQEGYLS